MDRAEAIRKIEYGLEMETSEPTSFGQLTVVRTDALKVALAALREHGERQWVSVNERLPEMKADVLVYFQNEKNMAVGFLCDVDEDKTMWCAYTDDGFYTDCDFEPSHWMPLPMPPKEGADHTCKTCYGSNMEYDEVDNPCWNCKGERSEWMSKEGADHEGV